MSKLSEIISEFLTTGAHKAPAPKIEVAIQNMPEEEQTKLGNLLAESADQIHNLLFGEEPAYGSEG